MVAYLAVPRRAEILPMRPLPTLLGLLLLPAVLLAEDVARYGVALDAKTYPQTTPQETFVSVLKAVEVGRIDYLLAHLADPAFVDERVKRLFAGKFEEQVADTRARLDPVAFKLLLRMDKEGEWQIAEKEARLSAKNVPDRSVYLKKLGDRWVLQNKQSP